MHQNTETRIGGKYLSEIPSFTPHTFVDHIL